MWSRTWALTVGVLALCTTSVSAASNVWSQISLSGDVPGSSYMHGLAADGTRLFLFGGHRGCTGYNCFGGSNELTQIDTESGVCTRLDAGANVTGIPPNPRNGMGFAAWDGVLYVFGGTAKDMSSSVHSYVSNELHSYHIGEKAWLKLDRSANVTGVEPGARRLMGFAANSASLWVTFGRGNWHACSGCPDSNMIGDAFRFEIGTRRWSALSSVSEARFELSLRPWDPCFSPSGVVEAFMTRRTTGPTKC